jgi:hypothetical protein
MGQLNLPDIDIRPPRPTYRDAGVIERVVEGILPAVMKWDGSTELDKPDLRIALTDALESEGKDAYRIAKNLDEQKLWMVDQRLVRELEALDSIWWQAELDAIKEWVLDNQIKPKFKVGVLVSVPHLTDDKTLTDVIGEVLRIDRNRAVYLVFCKSLGHVRGGVGTRGLIIEYENADPVKAI